MPLVFPFKNAPVGAPLALVRASSFRTSYVIRRGRIVSRTLRVLSHQLFGHNPGLASPSTITSCLGLRLIRRRRRIFNIVFLSTGRQILTFRILFRNDVSNTDICPHRIIGHSLTRGTTTTVFIRGRPSNYARPDRTSRILATQLGRALTLVRIHMLSRFVINRNHPLSLTRRN